VKILFMTPQCYPGPGGIPAYMRRVREVLNEYTFSRGATIHCLLQTRSLHKTRQLWLGGALARLYSISEWRMLASRLFSVEDIKVFGSKAELVPLPRGRVKNGILTVFPDSLSRLITNRLS
jgi:hypothetical protein